MKTVDVPEEISLQTEDLTIAVTCLSLFELMAKSCSIINQ